MKHSITTTALGIILCGSGAYAGGLDRSSSPLSVIQLFEEGTYAEFGFRYVAPRVSGVGAPGTPSAGVSTGEILDEYVSLNAAFKDDINDRFSYAFIYEQPYGSDTTYPVSTYIGSGTIADSTVNTFTSVLQYNIGNGFSVHGGLRIQSLESDVQIPFAGNYSVAGPTDWAAGYLVGAAYERPDIAARVSLTYNSSIEHDLSTTENLLGRLSTTTTNVDIPHSVNLEFQTGLSPKTLLYGSVRWAEWGGFTVAPPTFFGTFGQPVGFFVDDRWTYELGLGRQLSDNWTVFGSFTYEPSTGSPTGNLNPVDGFTRYTAGVAYQKEKMRTTLGITYIDLGGATSVIGGNPAGLFEDNSAVGIGLKLSWNL